MPDLAIKKPDHYDPASWFVLVESKQAENIIIGNENEQSDQKKENNRVQSIFKLLVRFLLGDRLVADENDSAAIKRRYRQQVDDSEVDA